MRLRPHWLLLSLTVACATAPSAPTTPSIPAPAPGKPLALPSQLKEGRFVVHPRTSSGKEVALFTDTGGGLYVTESSVRALGVPLENEESATGAPARPAIRIPAFSPDAWIPPLLNEQITVTVMPDGIAKANTFEWDGMLGQAWFAGRVWTFDYPQQKLWLRAPGDVPTVDAAHRVSLGFPTTAEGIRQANFPRIQIKVDGETLDLLFDTGASVLLTKGAQDALADGRPADRATSFITRSVFERWRQHHPEWRVVADADSRIPNSFLIEVPSVEVAGYTVGPVWFTTRADPNFHQGMSQFMDKIVEGALGGSALSYFRVTVDYPQAIAVFERLP
ncbi:hypothetical protein DRW03_34910 [Corallococcus sp. H22C18031201]|uniref:hypothetical protein n=1 Tax=Citreicoccus inhibens TaxID=2849499 RepID=UPI000E730053|nr:hypothetical protein [Citreicoccus inhibens]MBU8899107.1 hypothetical protein [Citreicoccus inhibens]RJS14519.1 hypothetical protein DRW03_34910 [Corallococcus sp. H22C18031201]